MDWSVKCAAVIPCLNEASSIGPMVAAVRLQIRTIFVVDDGSVDGTQERAKAAGAQVISYEMNRGKGAALRSGWRKAFESGFEWVLSLDGDGQHSPDDIPSFFDCAERTSAALVVGNRMAQAAHMPFLRRLVNRWMSRRISRFTGQLLPDSQCGFRLMRLSTWTGLQFESENFEIESEVLVGFLKAGHKVAFVPIQAIYKTEQSKIHPWRDGLRWWRWWRRAHRR